MLPIEETTSPAISSVSRRRDPLTPGAPDNSAGSNSEFGPAYDDASLTKKSRGGDRHCWGWRYRSAFGHFRSAENGSFRVGLVGCFGLTSTDASLDLSEVDVPAFATLDLARAEFARVGLTFKMGDAYIKGLSGNHWAHYEFRNEALSLITISLVKD